MFKKAEKHKQMTRVICMKLQFDMTLKFIEALNWQQTPSASFYLFTPYFYSLCIDCKVKKSHYHMF